MVGSIVSGAPTSTKKLLTMKECTINLLTLVFGTFWYLQVCFEILFFCTFGIFDLIVKPLKDRNRNTLTDLPPNYYNLQFNSYNLYLGAWHSCAVDLVQTLILLAPLFETISQILALIPTPHTQEKIQRVMRFVSKFCSYMHSLALSYKLPFELPFGLSIELLHVYSPELSL